MAEAAGGLVLREERARAARRVVLAVAAVVLVVMAVATGVQGERRVARNLRLHPEATVNDLGRWTQMLPGFLDGRSEYVDDGFPYPPIVLALMWPVTLVSQPAAQVVWACVQCALAAWIFAVVWGMVRAARGGQMEPAALALVLFVWLWPMVGDFQEGQTNLLMLLPLVLGLRLLQARRRGTDAGAGVLVALAISVKVTPLIFLVYLLVQRRWVAAAACVGGLGVWLLAAPAALFGWQRNLLWLNEWGHIMIIPYVRHGAIQYYTGQSVASFLTRLLRHVPAFTTAGAAGVPSVHYVNIADLPEAAVRWLTRGILLAVLGAGAWWMRRPLTSFAQQRYVVQVGCVAAFMVWASERTWIHHYVTLILPLMALGMEVSDRRVLRGRRLWGYAALALAGLAMLLTSDAARVFGRDAGDYVRAVGVPLLASAVLVAAMLWVGCGKREGTAAPG
ncbi:MAG TPA: glycosyltransferase family 87 protein [Phycisphaerae bacterium]|nr:glycosyltransferase family 87 protein [Phycisphaerae bacterium]